MTSRQENEALRLQARFGRVIWRERRGVLIVSILGDEPIPIAVDSKDLADRRRPAVVTVAIGADGRPVDLCASGVNPG